MVKIHILNDGREWSKSTLKLVDKDSTWQDIAKAISKVEGITEEEDTWKVVSEGVVGPARICEMRDDRHYLCICVIITEGQ